MYNLSWEEAQKAMSEGKKVKHRYFSTEEYFHLVDGRIYGEDGVCMNDGFHTDWYTGEEWQKTGWAIVH